ncbi:VCBS repeat-containing protein [candidate division KSB1 bacterium]|nr:VCBS repeat-containing protein [candidate division KSB1 bacterium]
MEHRLIIQFILMLSFLLPTDRNSFGQVNLATGEKNAGKTLASTFVPKFVELGQNARVAYPGMSISAVWVDFNRDGWLDLFVSNSHGEPDILYQNDGKGHFKDVTHACGLADHKWTYQSQWADFDNDGDIDCLIRYMEDYELFINQGDNHFVSKTALLPFPKVFNSAWADYDQDGWLDVYMPRGDYNREVAGSPENLFYHHLGNLEFENLAYQAGVAGIGDSYYASWIDYNNDGFLDLYVLNNFDQPDYFFQNQGNGTFKDIYQTTGIQNYEGSASWADFNNDGFFDFFLTDVFRPALYKNKANGTFEKIALPAEFEFSVPLEPGTSFDINWIDFNNDGFLDLNVNVDDSLFLFINDGDETFLNITAQMNLPQNVPFFGSIWGDYDNDGDLDWYIASKKSNLLLQNQGTPNHWLKIDLKGTISHPEGFGAKIRLVCGNLQQYCQLGIGEPTKSFSLKTMFFGIGQATKVDSVIVEWPSGIKQDTSNIHANQQITLIEPGYPLFTNYSIQAGIANPNFKTNSVSFIDFNGDDYPDIALGRQIPLIYKNLKDCKFQDVSQSIGISFSVENCATGYGDFNNDGCGDLYLANGIYTPNILLKNQNNQSFIDVTAVSGTAGGAVCSYDLALGDYNNDGLLDIFVANLGSDNLYLNQGNFQFTDVTASAGVSDTLLSYCTAGDYDNDGDLDIYVVNNRGGYDNYQVKKYWPNYLYQNNGDGTFINVTTIAGVGDSGNTKGACFGDYDNDGDLDLYIGNDGSPNRLFQNNGDGTFKDVTAESNVAGPLGTHGVVFADFDNDGFLDIYAAGGSYIPEKFTESMQKEHPDALYHNNGNGTFTDITKAACGGYNNPCTPSLAVADVDRDGDLDLFLGNNIYKGQYHSANVFLKNNGNTNHWVQFKLIGHKSNRFAIGAHITIFSNSFQQMLELSGGHVFGSQNSLIAHFGLGKRTDIDRVVIRWPSGIIQKLENLPVDHFSVIHEPIQLGPVQVSFQQFEYFKIGFLISAISLGLALIFRIGYIFIKKIRIRTVSSIKKAPLTIHLPSPQPEVVIKSPTNEIKKIVIPVSESAVSVLAIKFNLIKFRGEYLLTNSFETVPPKLQNLEIFDRHREERMPFPIKEIKLQRIEQKIEKLWEVYCRTLGGKKPSTSPLQLLKEIGEGIFNYFGNRGLFQELFQIDVENLHLNFILENPILPWHWAYYTLQEQFLCEKFSFSYSLMPEKTGPAPILLPKEERITANATRKPAVILFYGDWKGHFKELKQVKAEIEQIRQLLVKNAIQVYDVYESGDQFAAAVQQIQQRNENLRVIHYSGHIHQNFLDLGNNDFFDVSFLADAYGIKFDSQPVVFLNGCRSGLITDCRQKYSNLVTGFQGCGAGACVVTQFPVPEGTAKNFALRFYHYFLDKKCTVGQSLQMTRIDLGKEALLPGLSPENDITRYFYNLYGDGTIRF